MNRKNIIILFYIVFLICSSFVIREKIIPLVCFIYICIGFTGLYLYNRYKKLFISSINYLFTFYEFLVLLLVSNRDWMNNLLDSHYNKMSVFILLLFSFPTIFYVADKFFQKQKR